MDFPEIGIISEFEAGMKCLQTPSLFSRFSQLYSFWKWGALIVAFLATFSRILRKLKLLIVHIRRIKPSPESLLQHLDLDLDLSEDEDMYDDGASIASSDEEEDEPDIQSSTDDFQFFTDFSLKGSKRYSETRYLKNRSSRSRDCRGEYAWDDFSTGKNVVKIWDRLGLSLAFDCSDDFSDSESVVSLWDFDKEQKISDLFKGNRRVPEIAVAPSSPAVVLAAGVKEEGGVLLGAYDTRTKGDGPVAFADWGGQLDWWPAKGVRLAGDGEEKVYVGNDAVGVVAVGDMRKFATPLENVTATDGDMWWDADAIIAEDEFVDC